MQWADVFASRGMLGKEFKELSHFFYIPTAGNWKQTVKAFQCEGLNVAEFGSRGVFSLYHGLPPLSLAIETQSHSKERTLRSQGQGLNRLFGGPVEISAQSLHLPMSRRMGGKDWVNLAAGSRAKPAGPELALWVQEPSHQVHGPVASLIILTLRTESRKQTFPNDTSMLAIRVMSCIYEDEISPFLFCVFLSSSVPQN